MNKFLEEVKGEEVEFKYTKKERKLIPLTLEQVRKRKDGYYTIAVQSGGTLRKAIVPEDTIIRMIEEGTSPKVLRDRCNTLSALGNDFDKPLMYYAIVAYNLVPKTEWEKWVTSRPLLDYELIHLNGDVDDIRKDNVRLTIKNEKLWNEVKTEYKSEQKVGADKEYTRRREEDIRKKLKDYPNLKVMTRVTDVVKKNTAGIMSSSNLRSKDFIEMIL